MNLGIVLSTQPAAFDALAYQGDLERNIAKIAALGYAGVELAVRDPSLLDLEALEAAVTTNNLVVPAIGTGQAWGEEGLSFTDPDGAVRDAAIDRAKSHIPLAARMDATIIIGLLRGVLKEGVEAAQAMDWLVDALWQCCAAAKGHGVRLALEPLNRYETPLVNTAAEGLDLLEAVGAGNLGLLLDTFHMNIEEPVIEESIRACRGRIFHFHLADSNRWYPGAGHLDFASILRTLYGTGYEGFVSGEFMPLPDADTAAQRAIGWLRNL